MAQLFARMNLILAMTSLLPSRLHARWLNMAPIERQMRQSVKLFTDKFLVNPNPTEENNEGEIGYVNTIAWISLNVLLRGFCG